jgi:metal-dependent amidase/aminoacylase/carboxypeptidase family protein
MALLAEVKERAGSEVDRLATELSALGRHIHANPELGFGEYQACQWLTEFLEQHGLEVRSGSAGLRTAFRATLAGTGPGPTVAFILEYDASPEVDHGCGHNLIGPAHAGAAAAG